MQEKLQERFLLNADDYYKWTWLSRNHVAATDAAALASSNSINSIMTRKYSDYELDSKYIDWGNKREPEILKHFNLTQNRSMYHAEHQKRFIAMPDAIFEKDGSLVIAQVKTTSKDFKKIPKKYLRQVQWEMYVSGASSCLFIWEYHENFNIISLKSQWIDRDEEIIKNLTTLGCQLITYLDDALTNPSRYERTRSFYWA